MEFNHKLYDNNIPFKSESSKAFFFFYTTGILTEAPYFNRTSSTDFFMVLIRMFHTVSCRSSYFNSWRNGDKKASWTMQIGKRFVKMLDVCWPSLKVLSITTAPHLFSFKKLWHSLYFKWRKLHCHPRQNYTFLWIEMNQKNAVWLGLRFMACLTIDYRQCLFLDGLCILQPCFWTNWKIMHV